MNSFGALLVFLFFSYISASPQPLTLLSQSKYPNAKCLDGTAPGYYFEKAKSSEFESKFIFYLQGGGECDTKDACLSQTKTSVGSSNYFTPVWDSSTWYYANGDCNLNPHFCNYNLINVGYCSQDLHSGQRTVADDSTFGLYFSGHLNFKAVLDEMDELYNLQNATEIIVSGMSAGGIGVFMNVDSVRDRYPSSRVTAAVVAGMYFYATYYTGPNHTQPSSMADFQESAWPNSYSLYDAYVDEDCERGERAAGRHPSGCMLANISVPYIQSDIYATQAQTDITVLEGHDQFPGKYKYEPEEQEFMWSFSRNISVTLSPLLLNQQPVQLPMKREGGRGKEMERERKRARRSGVFSAACYIHVDFYPSKPLIQGFSYLQAFYNFYMQPENDNEYGSENNNTNTILSSSSSSSSMARTMDSQMDSQFNFVDDCGLICNPTC